MPSSFFSSIVTTLFDSENLSTLLNHLIQVYCFTYGILCLLTCILTTTRFIYADYLLQVKPISIASFILFWSMKLWLGYSPWMQYANYFLAIFIAIYFYDGCCNIGQNLNSNKQQMNTYAMVLIIVDVGLVFGRLFLRHGHQGKVRQHDMLEIEGVDIPVLNVLVLVFFAINAYRWSQRSLFPFLIVVGIVALTLFCKQLLLMKGFTKNIPFEALIYLVLVIDAQGRQYQQTKNKVLHHLFLACLYFYGFVITNQRNFPVEYVLLGVSIVMMALNK